MKTLLFCVNEQELKQVTNDCGNYYLVNNTHNYLQLKFKFNHTWGEYEKHIQFILNNEHYEYELAANDTIQVPKLFVENLGFSFLLIGYNVEEDRRITTNTFNIRLLATDWSDDITSYEDNTKDVYSLIETELEDTYTKEETDARIELNVKNALNLITYKIRTYGE